MCLATKPITSPTAVVTSLLRADRSTRPAGAPECDQATMHRVASEHQVLPGFIRTFRTNTEPDT